MKLAEQYLKKALSLGGLSQEQQAEVWHLDQVISGNYHIKKASKMKAFEIVS